MIFYFILFPINYINKIYLKVIKVEESVVNFFQTKIEIKLKKADAVSWTKLEFVAKKE